MAQTDGGRTVFDFRRNDAIALANPAAPARPVVLQGGDRFDPNEQRTTREDGKTPDLVFADATTVAFAAPRPPAVLRYTVDDTEPTASSTLYEGPLAVSQTTLLRARVFDPAWPGSHSASAETVVRLVQRPLAPELAVPPATAVTGLTARVYEIATKMWDNGGFFRANLVMLPDLDRSAPLKIAVTDGFALPHVVPAAPITQQTKGFYRWQGWWQVAASGTHTLAVDSSGPVLLLVGGQAVIDHTGVFHQHHTRRIGRATLAADWHPVELIVTDPLFWNLSTTGEMPFAVEHRAPGTDAFVPLAAAATRTVPPADAQPASAPVPQLTAEAPPPALERGCRQLPLSPRPQPLA